MFTNQVQRFKDMHHTDTDADFIYKKLEAIVDCYLDPQIPTEPPPEKVTFECLSTFLFKRSHLAEMSFSPLCFRFCERNRILSMICLVS